MTIEESNANANHNSQSHLKGTFRLAVSQHAKRSTPRGVACLVFIAFAVALDASDIGVAINGTCEAGSCPPAAFPFNSTDTQSVDFTLTLPDGDIYLINGSFTGTNNSDGGGFSTGHLFQVTYEGNATGGASAADTVTVEAYYAFQTTVATVVFSRDVGVHSVPQLPPPAPPAHV